MPNLQSTDTHWEHPISVVSMGVQAVASENRSQTVSEIKNIWTDSKLFLGVLTTSVFFSCLFSWTLLFFPIETTLISDEESQHHQAGRTMKNPLVSPFTK